MEETHKKRRPIHRWWVLGFLLLAVAVSILSSSIPALKPVQPHIQVAPEALSEPFSVPGIGSMYIPNTFPTLILTMIITVALAYAVKSAIGKGSMVPKGISGAIETGIEVLYNLNESTVGRKWAGLVFPWFATIMLYVLVVNLVKLLPGFETIGLLHHYEGGHATQQLFGNVYTVLAGEELHEGYVVTPFFRALSTDLNFTAALALVSVIATQVVGLKVQGFGYLSKFFNVRHLFDKPFFGAMDFLVGLLELISEFSKILSFAFRLFGNMFAGMVLLALVGSLIPAFTIVPSMIMMFEFFIGLIQAFVFGMLTMVFMSQATQGHGDAEHHE